MTHAENALLETADDVALADRMKTSRDRMVAELGKVIIGQDAVIEQVMLTLFAGGNSLLVGVPGLAKTLLVRTVADVLDLEFSRIQFTPDLMPSDITGTDIIQDDPRRPGSGTWCSRRGRCSPTCCWPTRSTARRRRRSRRCSRRCRSTASRSGGAPTRCRAVPRARDAEPDRARRHLPAARGAARPLHVPHRDRASAGVGGDRGPADDDRHPGRQGGARGDRRARSWRTSASCGACRWPSP